MTEPEWLACTYPQPMLEFLEGKITHRKSWLFSCACCRNLWHLITDARCRQAVEAGERYADGQISYDELCEASEEAFCRRNDIVQGSFEESVALATAFVVTDPAHAEFSISTPITAARATCDELVLVRGRGLTNPPGMAEEPDGATAVILERSAQAALLRDIVGNPFQATPALRPGWLNWSDGTIPNLAQNIYEGRTFDHLPILADALEDAGCTDPDILSHCRKPGPHVRGCWVVDLLLGKQ